MFISEETELRRLRVNKKLDPERRSELGQVFTPITMSHFMGSLFSKIEGDIELLEPGCGVGNLVSSFVDRNNQSNSISKINIDLYEIEEVVYPYLQETIESLESSNENLTVNLNKNDFIVDVCELLNSPSFSSEKEKYTHVIMNPPYRKIYSKGLHRRILSSIGFETVNLYSSFVLLSILRMVQGGEIVMIIPRSFCNGPYYKSFRDYLFEQIDIKHIHIFNNRSSVFSGDDVLQENIIIHGIKSGKQGDVRVSSSDSSDFFLDDEGQYLTPDFYEELLPFSKLVDPKDKEKFLHIFTSPIDELVRERMSVFDSTLQDLDLQISTGPIVSFRMKNLLVDDLSPETVPLLFPTHLKNWKLNYPVESKKPNSIIVTKENRNYLWDNKGYYLLVKRFSSKEEKKRISCTIYDSSLEGDLVGFDNKLNVFHFKKNGIDEKLVNGLFIYLNSTLVDNYYRHFGGHTQVNSTDLRNIKYPNKEQMIRLGKLSLEVKDFNQKIINDILNQVIEENTDKMEKDPIKIRERIED